MKIAYVDTSALVAVAFGESGARTIAGRLRTFQRLFSSNLLEAEFRSALAREGVEDDGSAVLSMITWVYPDRPLTREFRKTLALGRLRGADLWHLACALFLAPEPRSLSFVTVDPPQKEVARRLGFTV
jgi:predicted nucleic acid-binding protein